MADAPTGKRRPATAPHRSRGVVAEVLAADAARTRAAKKAEGRLRGLAAVDAFGQGSRSAKALFDAALLGDLGATERLIFEGIGPDDYADSFGCTALHVAARGGHRRLCAALIAAGANVNAADYTGATPLAAAVRKVRPECVRLLLESKADSTAADRWERVPLTNVLAGPGSTRSEQQIAAMLCGVLDERSGRALDTPSGELACRELSSAEEKLRVGGELQAAREKAREALQARDEVEAALLVSAERGDAACRADALRQDAEARRFTRPHAWAPFGGVGLWGDAGAERVAAEATAAEAAAAELAERAEARARRNAAGRATAREEAAWRTHYDPLQGRVRPEVAAPANVAAVWNRKAQAWERVAGGGKTGAVPVAGPGRSDVTTISGFGRLIESEAAARAAAAAKAA